LQPSISHDINKHFNCRGKHKNQLFRDTAAIHWKATTLLICLYGIVKEFRPATPFLTPYLVSSFKNFTDTELYSEIYPFWTYSYLIALIPIFFLTDILRYKTIIVLEAACLCATWALLVWGTNIRQMQLMQIVFGIASAAEIAYYSYMYAVVDQKHYKRITSYIRCAALVGKFLAFALAQLLISFRYGSYLLLNQISFASVCIILIIAVMLPPVSSKVIANKVQTADNRKMERNDLQKSGTEDNDDPVECEKSRANVLAVDSDILAYFVSIWNHFQIFRTNKVVLKWSLWWALTSCGIYQVYNYVQTLWATMQKDGEDTKNGLTECVNTMIGALIAFLVQYMHVNWVKCGEVALFVTSSIAALLVFALSQTTDIWIAYVLYVTLAAIYHMLMTAASELWIGIRMEYVSGSCSADSSHDRRC
uniref:Folate transporter 1 (inferred by orthology to a C. elegans protein) n=1 Tax=Anisakis simplex TaxID=6269 RepID=A0A0M3JVT9_ANISI